MSVERPEYVPWYPSRWLIGTMDLSADAEFVFFRLCMRAYESWSASVVGSDRRLATFCKMDLPRYCEALSELAECGKVTVHVGAVDVHSVGKYIKETDDRFEARRDRTRAATEARRSTSANVTKPNERDEGDKGEEGDKVKKEGPIGSRLPPDWIPEPLSAEFVKALGLTQREIANELQKFIDYWAAKAGKDGRRADWQATWRNWLRKAAEYKGRPGAGNAGKPGSLFEVGRRMMEEQDQ